MPHEYSVMIHAYLTSKIEEIQERQKYEASLDGVESRPFFKGQLEELLHVRKHLTDQFDLNTQKYYD